MAARDGDDLDDPRQRDLRDVHHGGAPALRPARPAGADAGWSQSIADWLPFKWAFYFPIQTLVGDLSAADLLGGLGMQALWTAVGAALVWVCFRASVKHYTAVGN